MEHSSTALASPLTRLVQAVEERNCILFVGAGVSMAVGLPSWSELIERMRLELDLSAESEGVTFQTLAEYYRLTQGSIGGLRSWMDRAWSVSEERVRDSRIHQRIVELKFPIVYTTNFDTILFIGYSMSDMNIRFMLHRLWRMWRDSGREKDRPPSFVFVASRDSVRDEVLEQWGISVLSNEENTPEDALLAFLDNLAEAVPARCERAN